MERRARELAALLAENLHAAFETLVRTYQQRLYAFVLERVGDHSVTEEIVQSAFIRAYYALRQYPAERIRLLHLSGWLYEITRNTLYNYQREQRNRAHHLLIGAFDLSDESAVLLLEDGQAGPEEQVFQHEEQRELGRYIERLPAHFQRAIRLYYLDNLSYQEIAEQLGLPVGTVKSHVYRGMQLLRSRMKEV